MSSMTHISGQQRLSQSMDDDRPERSRNAKAQARHRAKRKAYIEQLESTVTKLQTALGYTPDQVAALPPPLVKIRELEQENARLHSENEEMRRMMSEDPQNRGRIPPDYGRRTTFQDGRDCDDRDYKKRKVGEGVYMNQNDQHHLDARPPPLSIPQSTMAHQYGSQQPSSLNGSSTSLFNLHAPAFQMPNTPSGSSSTSSPPFSNFWILVTRHHLFTHQQPSAMQPSTHSPLNHRPPPLPTHQPLPNYHHSSNQYGSVKVEDEHFQNSHHGHPHSNHYATTTLPPFQSTHEPDWHTYSAERVQGHHR